MSKDAKWLDRLRVEIEQSVGSGSRLVVAVSGGGDSVALLRGLAFLRDRLNLWLMVAHLDHGLRATSAQDAAFVGQVATELGLFCVRERQDVAAQVKFERGNLEEVARRARYNMFERVASAVQADAIVVAHTADDQAETLLMHLLRGAGLDGLKGMTALASSPLPKATIPLFRPLLLIEGATLRNWLRNNGYSWCEDATNADTTFFRSRLRHEIIPYLTQEQPRLRLLLARTAQVLSGDHAWLESQTDQAWQEIARVDAKQVKFKRDLFLSHPIALQRRLLRRAFFHLRPTMRDLSYEQINQALAIAASGESGAQASLPAKLFLIVEYDTLWMTEQIHHASMLSLANSIRLPNMGTIHAAELTITLTSVGVDAIPKDWRTFPRHIGLFDCALLQWPLTLRPPKAKDRWMPLGMKGKFVTLRDWMAKHKVPLAQRDRTPLLIDAQGQILWVVGWQIGHKAQVRGDSQKLLRINISKYLKI